jgi:nucleotide-binding universal stress UspA family protein
MNTAVRARTQPAVNSSSSTSSIPGCGQRPTRTRSRRGSQETGRRGVQDSKVGGRAERRHPMVGRPDKEFVRLAEELGAGLVVVGGRGSGPFRRAALGSVSDSVVRHANCPVLMARGEEACG